MERPLQLEPFTQDQPREVASATAMVKELEFPSSHEASLHQALGPVVNREQVDISRIENLLKAANTVQLTLDRKSEAERLDDITKSISSVRSKLDEQSGSISLVELAGRVEFMGISREAINIAYEAQSRNKHWEDSLEFLAIKLGLPSDATLDAIKIEKSIREFVESVKPKIEKMLDSISGDPLGYPNKSSHLYDCLDLGPSHAAFEERTFDAISIIRLIAAPVSQFLLIAGTCNAHHNFSLPRILSPNLATPTSPALKELMQYAESHGGKIELRNNFNIGESTPHQVDVYLSLKKDF